jgi:hypothetical protein
MNMLRNPRMMAATLTAGLFLGLSPLAEARAPKWEYLVVTGALKIRNLEQMMNARGAEGWELVAFTSRDVAIFKRKAR